MRLSDYTRAAIRSASQLPPDLRARHLHEQQRYADLWRELLAGAHAAGELQPGLDLGAARMLLLGALNWSSEWWNPGRGSLRAVVGTAQRLLSAGLAPGSDPTPPLGLTESVSTAAPAARGTRNRILDAAAVVVLNRQGYAGTRLVDIGAVAGLQTPAIYYYYYYYYYYFASRDEVIEEVVQVGVRRTMSHVETALDALPVAGPDVRIAAAVRAHLEIGVRDADYAAAAIQNAGQLPGPIRRVRLLDQRRYAALWRGLLASAADAGLLASGLDIRSVRMLVIGALNSAPGW
ncbi:hypothetical protein [Pseudonocardia sp. NPDC049154]|uniref:hypothetical protein n=1 Tax=Pseudonocardia sp. NPDC049154 TaxID=3155501 RepID=UPI003404AAF6